MELCKFCEREFRNAQAVRAHLRFCEAYRPQGPRTPDASGTPASGRGRPQAGVPRPTRTRRRPARPTPLPAGSDEFVGLWDSGGQGQDDEDDDPGDPGIEARRREEVARQQDRARAEEARAAAQVADRRRREEAEQAAKGERRRTIQAVKDQVIGQWWAFPYTIPPELKAEALRAIEAELSALAVDEIPQCELITTAEGLRDRIFRPAIDAQEAAKRRAEAEAADAGRRAAAERDRAWAQQREAAERARAKQRLVAYGLTIVDDALRDEPDLDFWERVDVGAEVRNALEAELTGTESEADVNDLVDELLDEALEDPEEEDEQEDEDEDDEDDDDDD